MVLGLTDQMRAQVSRSICGKRRRSSLPSEGRWTAWRA
jgi:hypothetical protein